jgi:hypothetical protein
MRAYEGRIRHWLVLLLLSRNLPEGIGVNVSMSVSTFWNKLMEWGQTREMVIITARTASVLFLDLGRFFSFWILYIVGRTPWRGSARRKAARYLHTDIHALSRIRTHDPSDPASEDGSCLRPRGHCDRLAARIGLVSLFLEATWVPWRASACFIVLSKATKEEMLHVLIVHVTDCTMRLSPFIWPYGNC